MFLFNLCESYFTLTLLRLFRITKFCFGVRRQNKHFVLVVMISECQRKCQKQSCVSQVIQWAVDAMKKDDILCQIAVKTFNMLRNTLKGCVLSKNQHTTDNQKCLGYYHAVFNEEQEQQLVQHLLHIEVCFLKLKEPNCVSLLPNWQNNIISERTSIMNKNELRKIGLVAPSQNCFKKTRGDLDSKSLCQDKYHNILWCFWKWLEKLLILSS